MNHFISLDTAEQMTSLYRAEKDNVINPAFAGKGILSISETFDRAAFDRLLAQPGCAALRIYYGMSPDLKIHAIIVSVNSQNEDMLPPASASDGDKGSEGEGEDDDPVIVEIGTLCPPGCPPPSGLNP